MTKMGHTVGEQLVISDLVFKTHLEFVLDRATLAEQVGNLGINVELFDINVPEHNLTALWLPPSTTFNLITKCPLSPSLIGCTLAPRVSPQTKLFRLVT